MKVRRKSLHRSANAKRAKKFAAMRAAKERKRIARLSAAPTMSDTGHSYQPPKLAPLFVITIRCRDGVLSRIRVHEGVYGLIPSATACAKKIAMVLRHYRPANFYA